MQNLNLNKQIIIRSFIGMVIAITVIIVYALFCKKPTSDLVISYLSNGKSISINNGDTAYLETNTDNSISVNNFVDLGSPNLDWSVDEEYVSSTIEPQLAIKGGRCYISSVSEGTARIKINGDKINDFSFVAEFHKHKIEFPVKDMAWTSGNIDYYFLENGSCYLIYEDENNYLKGSYNYIYKEKEEIPEDILKEFDEYINEAGYYELDINVDEEYLDGTVYNNDSYVIYLCGDGDNMALHDGGWGFTKEAFPIEIKELSELEEYITDASDKANKKVSKKKLGDIANTGWSCKGVNYYFYDDGEFDFISIVNHDFIRGSYKTTEITTEDVEEKLLEKLRLIFEPQKLYLVECNINDEVYDNQDVSVTSLCLLIAKNGNKYCIYDSNWDEIEEAKKSDLIARDDFEIFFERNIKDITNKFKDSAIEANGVKYYFFDDGIYYSCNEDEDIYIKGSYLITDVFDDLIPSELLSQIESENYYYIEIEPLKIWHERTGEMEENIPAAMYMIVTADAEENQYIYDDYYNSYAEAGNIPMIKEIY